MSDVRQDLTPYRELSERIFELLRSYTPFVERLVSQIYKDPTLLCSRMRLMWIGFKTKGRDRKCPPLKMTYGVAGLRRDVV